MANFHPKQPPHQRHGTPTPTPTPTPSPLQQPLAIILPDPPSHHNHLIRLAMIIMACMVGVLMFLCTVSVIIKHFHSRRHNRNRNSTDSPILFDVNNNEQDPDDSPISDDEEVTHPIWFIRTVGLQQPFIDSITVFKYGKDEGLIDGTECSVCLGEFQQGESLRLLPKCSHAFHIPCIDTWLRSHKNCPLCRAPVARDEGAVRAVDQNNTINNNQTDENVSDHHQNQEADTENYEGSGGSDGVRIGETQLLRRSVSVDLSSSDSVMFRDVVVDLSSEGESSETQFGEKMDSNGKDMRNSSSSNCKVGSIGGELQKRPVSMRRSFSHSSKFLFSKHSRSQSSTLPL